MKLQNILWGILLIILGVILGINALGFAHINFFFPGWWTLFLLIPSGIGLLTDKEKMGHLIVFLLGIFLFLSCNEIVSFALVWKLSFPTILILVGMHLLTKNIRNQHFEQKRSSLLMKNGEHYAIFRSVKQPFSHEQYIGSNINAIFGEFVLDLRESNLEKETRIDATALFGTVKILLPENCFAIVRGVPIFGSIRNQKSASKENCVYIHVTTIFGEVSVF